MSANLNLDVVTTGQSAKEATINAAFAELDSKLTATLTLSAYTGPTLSQMQRNGVILYTGVAAATSITFPGTFTGMQIVRSDPSNTHAAHLVCGTATYDLPVGDSVLLMFDGTANGMFELAGGGGGGSPTMWRIHVDAIASGSNATMGELVYSLSGTSQTPSGAVASNSYDPTGQPVSNLYDGNATTWWGGASLPVDVDYTFATGQRFDKVTITPRPSPYYTQAPDTFEIYCSYDSGVTFILAGAFTHTWTSDTPVDFTFTTPAAPTYHTLASLTDVNVTEGSGIDKDLLKWDNATSKWIPISPLAAVEAACAAAPTSAPGGGPHLWLNAGVLTYS